MNELIHIKTVEITGAHFDAGVPRFPRKQTLPPLRCVRRPADRPRRDRRAPQNNPPTGLRFVLDGAAAFPYAWSMAKAKGADSAGDDILNLPFEEALKRLEAIAEAMEAQDLPLESLLARYQEGTALAQLCQKKLNEAEVKIQQLEKNGKGELSLKSVPNLEAP